MSQITLTQIKSAYPYLTSSFDGVVADYRALHGRWKRLKEQLNSLPKRDSIVIMQDKIEILSNIHEVKEKMLTLRQWMKAHVKPTADRLRQTARAVEAVSRPTPSVAPVVAISPEKIAQLKQLIDSNPAVKALLQAIASKLPA